MRMLRWMLVGALGCVGACEDSGDQSAPETMTGDGAAETEVAAEATAAPETEVAPNDTTGDVTGADTEVVVPGCGVAGTPRAVFAGGPYGVHRGDVAEDFTVPLGDGTSWSYAGTFTGCDVVVVVPDSLRVSDTDATSLWEVEGALEDLTNRSPDEVQYLFIANSADAAVANPRILAMQARIEALIAGMSPNPAGYWRARLHVAAVRAQNLDNWVGRGLLAHLQTGLAIDRQQRIRGIGMLADVRRFDAALQQGDHWPWKGNLGYAAYDAAYLHAEGERAAALEAAHATVVELWKGETLAEVAETDVALPDAATLANFDTLEVEVSMACPNPDQIEFGNCGAWDYLASLFLRTGDAANPVELEVARFITSYHRETHWVVDASALLPRLAAGGTRHFRWSFAPSWNTQPTATRLSLRFSTRGRGLRPVRMTPLFGGGDFGSAYNTGRAPVVVPIGAGTKRVELWAVTSGHGSGTSECAEFCQHQHEFTVAGHVHLQTFPEAGNEDGCIAHLASGMVPNQGGTWWFGRGGWCPGAPVAPWIVDVTSEVTRGSDATISYRGLLAGSDPPDGAGNIVLTSYLVEFE